MSDLPVTEFDKTEKSSISFITCDGIIDYPLLVERASRISLPVGSVVDFYIDDPLLIPRGWVLADGSSFDPLACPELAQYLGSSTLPDLTDAVVGMVDVVGGVIENYYPNATQINTIHGNNQITLLVGNIPPHDHEYTDQKLDIRLGVQRVENGSSETKSNQDTFSSRINTFDNAGTAPATPFNTMSPFLKNFKIIRCY